MAGSDPLSQFQASFVAIRDEVIRLRERNRELERQSARADELAAQLEKSERQRRELTAQLSEPDFDRGLNITKTHRAMLGVMLKRKVATIDALRVAIENVTGHEVMEGTVKVHVQHMRERLKPHGVHILTEGHGVGWFLDDPTRSRLLFAAQ